MPTQTSDAIPLPLLEARGIERRYGGITVWKNLDFQCAAGEVVLVVGPNGAGKTTLLRSLAGLARPSRGSIQLFGRDLYTDHSARALIGFVGHDSMLYDDLTARENLRFAAAINHLSANAIDAALAAVGLLEQAEKRVGRFSRGMVQRLALARSTLHTPMLLLLDEPFTGLDRTSADALRARLEAERDRGHAVICVTHDPSELWDIATRVVVLTEKQLRLDRARPATLAAFHAQVAELDA